MCEAEAMNRSITESILVFHDARRELDIHNIKAYDMGMLGGFEKSTKELKYNSTLHEWASSIAQ